MAYKEYAMVSGGVVVGNIIVDTDNMPTSESLSRVGSDTLVERKGAQPRHGWKYVKTKKEFRNPTPRPGLLEEKIVDGKWEVVEDPDFVVEVIE